MNENIEVKNSNIIISLINKLNSFNNEGNIKNITLSSLLNVNRYTNKGYLKYVSNEQGCFTYINVYTYDINLINQKKKRKKIESQI